MLEIKKVRDKAGLMACLEVRHRVFTVEKAVPQEIEVDEKDALGGDCDHILISWNNTAVGAMRCERHEKAVRVQRFCILKEYRGRGLGRAALTEVEKLYRSIGCEKMELDSKYSAWKFYQRLGYKCVSDIFIEADVEHIKMEKSL